MPDTPPHGLSPHHLAIIAEVLAPFADRITEAALFGSRATGRARPNSDIDLVLFGDIDQPTLDRIWTRFDESPLPFTVDVQADRLIAYPPLKAHIASVKRPLFVQRDLSHFPVHRDR